MVRGAANTWNFAEADLDDVGSVTVDDGTGGSTTIGHEGGTPTVQLRTNAADAEGALGLGIIVGAPGLTAGAGGASTVDTFWLRSAAGVWSAGGGGVTGVWAGVTFDAQSDPAAPAANDATLYARDNGAGKTQLCVRFPTGAVQVIATEP
jgi:hypothetical protein